MDRQIRRLGIAFLALFVLLFAQINFLQVFAAGRLAGNPANSRLILNEYDVQRGAILASDERTVLARSVATSDTLKYRRMYPRGSLYGQLTGYYSLIYGRSGLEFSQNPWLAGTAPELTPQNFVDEILGRPKRGATVVTTLDAKLQRVAARALGDLPGAVVALDPRTGAVLAMVGHPSYDPNPLASHDDAVSRAAWAKLNRDPAKPLLSQTSQELYPPGSTFKLITASAALENGMRPGTLFPNPPSLDLPQTTHNLENFGGEHCFGGAPQITIAQALQVSCNVVFGEIGLKLGAGRLVTQAERYGFNQRIPFEVPFAEGQIPPVSSFTDNLPLVALSAIGQASVGANPLQMAMVGQAIANHGEETVPRLVKEIRDASGRVIKTFGPELFGHPISPHTAAELTTMMVSVVQAGTGTAAQIPGVTVAGKTGTAEHPGGNPDAWFVSFAPAERPQIVVAVIVLDGGSMGSEATGGAVAAPIARAVIQAALGR